MYSDANLQLLARTMTNLEVLNGRQYLQRHVSDFGCVVTIWLRESTGNHVCVANRLHLAILRQTASTDGQ